MSNISGFGPESNLLKNAAHVGKISEQKLIPTKSEEGEISDVVERTAALEIVDIAGRIKVQVPPAETLDVETTVSKASEEAALNLGALKLTTEGSPQILTEPIAKDEAIIAGPTFGYNQSQIVVPKGIGGIIGAAGLNDLGGLNGPGSREIHYMGAGFAS
ncbi:MAG: hypothetical protein HYU64_07805 [Armatimonadetes bacterium]|nr:hypothetical protein [Armatimonadota bacterium]